MKAMVVFYVLSKGFDRKVHVLIKNECVANFHCYFGVGRFFSDENDVENFFKNWSWYPKLIGTFGAIPLS